MSIVYHNILDVGSFSHTLDLVGEKFKTPVLSTFCTMWLPLFLHSPKTKAPWKEQTGKLWPLTAKHAGGVDGEF